MSGGPHGTTRQLQAQPLDVLIAEVYSQSQHLSHFSRGEAPCQRTRVGTPVIKYLSHLWGGINWSAGVSLF